MAVIKVQPWGKDQGDFVLIDEESFDEQTHELYVEGATPLSNDDKKFNALIVKLDSLSDKEIKFCAKHLGFEFTTKDETIAKINEFLEKKEGE